MFDIWDIKDLFRNGLFDQALDKIEGLPKSQMMYGEILKAEILEKQGRLAYAEEIITSVLNRITEDDVVLQFLAEVMKAGIVFKMGDYGMTKKTLHNASSLNKLLPSIHDRELNEVIANFKRIQGNFSYFQGSFENAIKSFEDSLKIFEKLDLQADIAMIYHDMGQIQGFMGNYKTAHEYYESAFLIQEQLNHRSNMAICLHKLIETNIRIRDELKSSKYLERLEIISQQAEDELIPHLYKFSRAIFLKENHRLTIKFKSQDLFREIIDGKIIDHNLTMISMLNYGELLLDELKLTNEDIVANEIGIDLVNISKSISNIAFSFNSIPLMIEILIMQSRFAALKGDFQIAEDILRHAVETAKEKGMEFLIKKVSDYSILLKGEYKSWLQIYTAVKKYQYDLEILDITRYLDSVKRIMDIEEN